MYLYLKVMEVFIAIRSYAYGTPGVVTMYPTMKDRERSLFHDDVEEDLSIYSKKGREERLEQDALHHWEDAIMQGYEDGIPEQLEDEEEQRWMEEVYPEEVA